MWAGVDVGGARKGFDAAVVDRHGLVAGPRARLLTAGAVVDWLTPYRPCVVAVDSPIGPAPDGARSRASERELARAGVCGIRFTPDGATIRAGGGYYEWIRRGFELYAALGESAVGWEAIEVFPTAAWTRWLGSRGAHSRARWSAAGLARLGLCGAGESRLSQDGRDAIAAAVTARLFALGRVDRYGEIVVPAVGSLPVHGTNSGPRSARRPTG